jgi:hypothetical protein
MLWGRLLLLGEFTLLSLPHSKQALGGKGLTHLALGFSPMFQLCMALMKWTGRWVA